LRSSSSHCRRSAAAGCCRGDSDAARARDEQDECFGGERDGVPGLGDGDLHTVSQGAGDDILGSSLRPVVGDQAELARLLADQDRTTLLEAVRTAVGGALTEEDIRLISNRKCRRRLTTARS
jgi:hypothetical protein